MSVLEPPATFVPLSAVSNRYEPTASPLLLTGTQAVGRLLIEQHERDARSGLTTASFVSGYRGSPLGSLDRTLAAIPRARERYGIHLSPGLNEELGATAVWGSQLDLPGSPRRGDGVIGVWYGKSPGLDRAGDAIRHGNLHGAHPQGGVLVLAGDDPGAKSSTLPCASERTLAALSLPILYPGSSQDIIRLGLYGIALSRASGLWVGMKIVADVADGLWSVTSNPASYPIIIPQIEWQGLPWQHRQGRAATLPWSRDAEEQLVGPRWDLLLAFARANPLDTIEVDPPTATFGIVAAGKTYSDLLQALTNLGVSTEQLAAHGIRLMRLGLIHPVEPHIVRRFARDLRTVLVVEEKKSFLESQIREILYGPDAPHIIGKRDEGDRPLIPAHGALAIEQIATALRRSLPIHLNPAPPPAAATELTLHRTAYFCSGCPHSRSTLVPEGSLAGGGIGCHAMALRMPQTAAQMTGITQMGGEGAQWIGQAAFNSTSHIFQNLGDGTYFHSGQLAVQACIAAGVNITFKLLYNSAVAMTGGQTVDGTLPVPDLTRKLHAEGVVRVIVCADEPDHYGTAAVFAPGVEIWHRDRLDEAQRVLRDTRGVTVLIYDQLCAAEGRRLRKRGLAKARTRRVIINEAVCEGCGDCGVKSNCLSVVPVETELGRKTRIDADSCNLDYSCLAGECPAFMTVELDESSSVYPSAPPVSEPQHSNLLDRYSFLMAGIGGTGVVTVSHVLAAAAMEEGLHVAGVDQTGLSQKAGPVMSHLQLTRSPAAANRVSTRQADVLLAFDALAAAEREALNLLSESHTVAVINTGHTPTGAEVRYADVHAPPTTDLLDKIRSHSQRTVTLDSARLAKHLTGSSLGANMLLLGAAYQSGALPLTCASIEAAIRTNGVAVEANLAAFRWGRHVIANPAFHGEPATCEVESELLRERSFTGALRRLLNVRAELLMRYQNRATAMSYLDDIERVWTVERRLGDQTVLSEAAARGLHRLIAYKDEFEVARLLLEPATHQQIEAERAHVQSVQFWLQPPFFTQWGLRRKIPVSIRWMPLLRVLAAGKRVRGTFLDPFGRTPLRKLERSLPERYRKMLINLLATLNSENYERAVNAAEAAQLIRGYERVKETNVKRFLQRLEALNVAFPQ
jgi:indolepyruvate ferredoxin oxidoreductase